MFSLIIADDDRVIRESLKTRFDWETMGFEVVGVMEDGSDVISYLKHNRVDAILTDILMYEASGLDIACYVHEHNLPVKILLLSGYQNFEYARQGIRYGVFDYILKPIDPQAVQGIFERLALELKKSNQKKPIKPYTALEEEQILRLFEVIVRHEKSRATVSVGISSDEDFCPLLPDASSEARTINIQRCFDKAINQLGICGSPLSYSLQSVRAAIAAKPDECIRMVSDLLLQNGMPLPVQQSEEILKAKEYMHKNLQNTFSAEVVAKEVHLSVRQLMRRFAVEVGKTYGDYLLWLRMTRSVELLTGTTKLGMNEICARTGFGDVKYFSKVFRSYFGCMPKDYMNRKQKHGK